MSTTPFTPEPPIYTFRIRILGCMAPYAPPDAREIQREIEIAANDTLEELAYAILDAYDFGEDHLWSFFLSGKAWDSATEYTLDTDDAMFPDLELPLDADATEVEIPLDAEGNPDISSLLPMLQPNLDAFPLTRAFIVDYLKGLPDDVRAAIHQQMQLFVPTLTAESATAVDDTFVSLFLLGIPPDVLTELEEDLRDTSPEERDALLADFHEEFADQLLVPPGSLNPFANEEEPAGWADETLIRDVPYPGKTGKKEFLFLFDYGDEWHFGVKLLGTSGTLTPDAEYPRVTAARGEAPQQYPPWDEDDEEDGEWEDEEVDPNAPVGGTLYVIDPKTGTLTKVTDDPPPGTKKK